MAPARTIEELTGLRGHTRRMLAVFAPPDDESYGCAGAFARAGADADAAAVLLCLTTGHAAPAVPPPGGSPFQAQRTSAACAFRRNATHRVPSYLDSNGAS